MVDVRNVCRMEEFTGLGGGVGVAQHAVYTKHRRVDSQHRRKEPVGGMEGRRYNIIIRCLHLPSLSNRTKQ